ncbi:uncharacterized protein AMSG_08451 [Thecamonas trahens ATCC 50062]|uniref:Fibronectin type-III domain-containing protein n=1 Tax=Thecamonas trahens ATCC 50062 TaxID=461836 RepID=A0A0L0DMI1_THETB|nr:hypothetical protein AMSG_08451 [Thecamonas trahens ATCC 50062]KNC52588.1 hypothetical protein AMSG_08451 [Thecamonas trahens ATCC 50062]|eukprot:XP_013755147.1 hypothetical protein AMSG_08451 [Thecamonas trahens ATCC 50062]
MDESAPYIVEVDLENGEEFIDLADTEDTVFELEGGLRPAQTIAFRILVVVGEIDYAAVAADAKASADDDTEAGGEVLYAPGPITYLPSEVFHATTLPDVPEAPAQVTVGKFTSSWIRFICGKSPADNGKAITEYIVHVDDGSLGGSSASASGRQGEAEFVACRTFTIAVASNKNAVGKAIRIDSLAPGSRLAFRCAARNELGLSAFSPITHARLKILPPSEPLPPTLVSARETALTLAWRPPESVGGAPRNELAYCLSMAAGAESFKPTFRGGETTAEVSGLAPATEYTFRLVASNSKGESPPSTVVTFATAAGVAHPPTKLKIDGTVAPTSLRMVWTAPLVTGGLPVSAYRVYLNSALYLETEQCHARVNGLQPGLSGTLEPVAAAQVLHPAARPAQPAAVTVTAMTHDSIEVAWEAPDSQGAPLLSFELSAVAVARDGTEHTLPGLELPGRARQACLADLTPSTLYKISLVASNSTGASNPSQEVAVTTPPPPPGLPPPPLAPPSVIGVTLDTLVLGWAPLPAAAQDPRAPLSAYVVYQEALARTGSVEKQHKPTLSRVYMDKEACATLRQLDDAHVYRFALALRNRVGETPRGPWTEWLTLAPQPPPTPPPAPRVGETTASGVEVSVALPERDGLAPFVRLDVLARIVYAPSLERSETMTLASGAVLSYTSWAPVAAVPVAAGMAMPVPVVVSGLSPGMSLELASVAWNALGMSPRSERATATLRGMPPSQMEPPALASTGAVGQESIGLRWHPPEHDFGAPVFKYVVYSEVGLDDAGLPIREQLLTTTKTAAEISGLSPGTRYRFSVAGVSSEGISAPSEVLDVMTLPPRALAPQPPMVQPHSEPARANAGEVTLVWDEAAPMSKARKRKLAKARKARGVVPTTQYELFVDETDAGDGWRLIYAGSLPQYEFQIPDEAGVRVKVRGLGAGGERSAFSSVVAVSRGKYVLEAGDVPSASASASESESESESDDEAPDGSTPFDGPSRGRSSGERPMQLWMAGVGVAAAAAAVAAGLWFGGEETQ